MKNQPLNLEISIAYYKEGDWERFLESIDDRDKMHKTWKEWHTSFLKTKNELMTQGFKVHEFVVDIDKLNNYCRIRRIKNDGSARSRFVTHKN